MVALGREGEADSLVAVVSYQTELSLDELTDGNLAKLSITVPPGFLSGTASYRFSGSTLAEV